MRLWYYRSMNEQLVVERLTEYSDGDAGDIGRLMSMLGARFDGAPIPQEVLEAIIESSYHDQLVARLDARIVGTATMSIVMGAGMQKLGYLQDFVVDTGVQGRGVADALWQEMMNWCHEHGVELEFTSGDTKQAAHAFYAKHGASVRDTTVFHVAPED